MSFFGKKNNSQSRIHDLEARLQECEAKVLSLMPINGKTPAAAKPLPLLGNIAELNTMIGTLFKVRYDPTKHENGLELRADQDLFTCKAPAITLECLHADATNLDCFIHSFLIATCPNFRAAKVTGVQDNGYKKFATEYRTKTCTQIAELVYSNTNFVPLGGKSTTYTVSDLKRELLTENAPLPDDLVKCLCFYYNINIIIIGPGNSGGRMARLVQGHEQLQGYTEAYVISNKYGGHFEPCRVQAQNRYLLRENETECIVKTYNSFTGNPMHIGAPIPVPVPVPAGNPFPAGNHFPARVPDPDPATATTGWECPKCTYQNKDSNVNCEICGNPRPSSDPKPIFDPKNIEKFKKDLTAWLIRNPEQLPAKLNKKGGRRTLRSYKKKRPTRFRRISSHGRRQ